VRWNRSRFRADTAESESWVIIAGLKWRHKQSDARAAGRVRDLGGYDGDAVARCSMALLRCMQYASSD
jgi:hypothetical protein